MEAMLANAPPFSRDECCIYRVPPRLRKLKQDAYIPKIVSIGPFHHGNRQLLNMEGHKQMYCRKFIERSEANFDELVTCVQELEAKVRRCYSEDIKLDVDKLVKVILVDCCFVLELLVTELDDSSEQSKPWLMKDIMWDLILLENQLPFFVFDKVYNLSFASVLSHGHPSFMRFACNWFLSGKEVEQEPPMGSIAHFIDLYRYSFLQPNYKQLRIEKEVLAHLYSATELNEAGVKFKVNNESKSFLDIQFVGCFLKIPQFLVSDSTEMRLRNLVAFEQCHYLKEFYITYYVQFLDFLIDTDKDVDLLVKNGIIRNWLGNNKEVAKMFNRVCKNVVLVGSNTNYLYLSKELNGYHDHPCHSKMASLRHDYCNTPWRTAASIAGIFLLILTIIQTVCSILQVL